MTKDEILENIKMEDVLRERGITVRNNMCSCPFHGADKKPSMKVFKNGYHCFTCQANGDLFTFVKNYDGVNFHNAFISLGGTYEHMSEQERNRIKVQRERVRKERERKLKAESDLKRELAWCMSISRKAIEVLQPCTDEWCFFVNQLFKLEYAWDCKYISNEEVDEIDVIRICRETRQGVTAIIRLNG